MKPVYQAIVDSERGDCTRAVIASILEIELEQVPHFNLFGSGRWFEIFYYFMMSNGWKYEGQKYPARPNRLPEYTILSESDSIKGCFYASVPSKTFPGKSHAVVMDMNWTVVMILTRIVCTREKT